MGLGNGMLDALPVVEAAAKKLAIAANPDGGEGGEGHLSGVQTPQTIINNYITGVVLNAPYEEDRATQRTLRACLISSKQQRDKGQFSSLQGVEDFSLAVFPKQAIILKPAERALDNPPFRENHKFMEFITLYDLNLRIDELLYSFSKGLTRITAVYHGFQTFRQLRSGTANH